MLMQGAFIPRPKKCKGCGERFLPVRRMQAVCDWQCGLIVGKAAAAKKAERARIDGKKLDRAAREAMKTLPELRAEAQDEFNTYIRLRDAGKPCICCNAYPQSNSLKGGEWDAGHYRSRGAALELAFDEDNCHAQTKKCNRRAWDVASYRANLLIRIGAERLAALEGPHPPKKYTRDELREIRDEYRAKARELMKQGA